MERKAPDFEIWARHEPFQEYQTCTRYLGRNDIPDDVIEKLAMFRLPVSQRILNVESIEKHGDRCINFNLRDCLIDAHVALNKPTQVMSEEQAKIARKIKDRKSVATNASIFPWTMNTITITADGYMVLGDRSKGQISIGNYFPAPGGYSNMLHKDENEDQSLFVTAYRKFLEEFGLANNILLGLSDHVTKYLAIARITEITTNGLVYADAINRGFTVPFCIRTDLHSEEINMYFQKNTIGTTRQKYDALRFEKFTGENIERMVGDNVLQMHGGLGLILLVGRNYLENGHEWYEHMLKEVIPYKGGRVLTLDKELSEQRGTVQVKDFLKKTGGLRYSS